MAMMLVFSVCFAFWLALSGSLAPLPLTLGVVSSAAVAWANRDLELVSRAVRVSPRLVTYVPRAGNARSRGARYVASARRTQSCGGPTARRARPQRTAWR